jgi:hypothetical protein
MKVARTLERQRAALTLISRSQLLNSFCVTGFP